MTGSRSPRKTARGVQVCVRVRPILPKDGDIECAIEHKDEQTGIVRSDERDSGLMQFDRLFDGSTTQVQVFEEFIKPAVENVMNGFNGTIFAYGQSSSGKTTTMVGEIGDPDMEGLVPRVIDAFYKKANSSQEEGSKTEYLIHCSVLEVYNEKIRDLLGFEANAHHKKKNSRMREKQKTIRLRERPDGTVIAEGAVQKVCLESQDMLAALQNAFEYRMTAATNKNHVSSRSHLIITLVLEAKKTLESENKKIKKSKKAALNLRSRLNLVDLAGSESLKKDIRGGNAEVSDKRVSETLAINTSLQALARVITALSKAHKHVPYRDSVLTRLLQDSLGGNSVTQMIACVSPSPVDTAETISTMRYAMFARKIKNSVFKDQDPKDMLLETMQKEVQELKQKLAEQRQHEEKMHANLMAMQRKTNEISSTALNLLERTAPSRSSLLPGRALSSVASSTNEGQQMLAKIQFLNATREKSPVDLKRNEEDPLDAALNKVRQRRRRMSELTLSSKRPPLSGSKKKEKYKRSTWTEGQFQELLHGGPVEEADEAGGYNQGRKEEPAKTSEPGADVFSMKKPHIQSRNSNLTKSLPPGAHMSSLPHLKEEEEHEIREHTDDEAEATEPEDGTEVDGCETEEDEISPGEEMEWKEESKAESASLFSGAAKLEQDEDPNGSLDESHMYPARNILLSSSAHHSAVSISSGHSVRINTNVRQTGSYATPASNPASPNSNIEVFGEDEHATGAFQNFQPNPRKNSFLAPRMESMGNDLNQSRNMVLPQVRNQEDNTIDSEPYSFDDPNAGEELTMDSKVSNEEGQEGTLEQQLRQQILHLTVEADQQVEQMKEIKEKYAEKETECEKYLEEIKFLKYAAIKAKQQRRLERPPINDMAMPQINGGGVAKCACTIS